MTGSKSKSMKNKGPSTKKVSKPAAAQVTEAASVAVSTKRKQKNAEIEYARDGRSCVITHEERFATILGSTSFATNSYPVNPGQSATFPWLSGVANRFESYRFEKLEFLYRTKTATTALGDVILAVDYDATDAAPTDSIQAEAYDESVSAAPWQNLVHKCRTQNMRKLPTYYVRGDSQPSSTDLKMYDMANLFVCTENQASAALVGYMYVRYTVRLMTPQLRSNDFGVAGGWVAGGGTMSAANPLGSAPTADAQNRGFSVDTNSVVTFQNPGTYLVALSIAGTTVSGLTATAGTALSATSLYGIVHASATAYLRVYSVVTNGANQTVVIAGTAASITGSNVWVGSSPYGSHALASAEVPKPDFEECRARILARNAGYSVRCPNGCACSRLRVAPGSPMMSEPCWTSKDPMA